MLIDATHRRWMLSTAAVAAVALVGYLAFTGWYPVERRGGSTVGLWYGVLGTALMVYVGLLSALRKVPSWWWLGSRKVWLRGHVWMGLLSAVFILCHSGFSWGGSLEAALWAVLIAVVVTGVAGIALQQFLPRLLTARVPCEAPYEQIPHICRVMRGEADALIDGICGPYQPVAQDFDNSLAVAQYADDARAQLRDFYEHDVRPFLAPAVPRGSALLDPLQAEARFSKLRKLPGLAEAYDRVERLARLCEERRLLREQERLHFWLHAWLLVHVPLSAVLLVLGAAHMVTALYY